MLVGVKDSQRGKTAKSLRCEDERRALADDWWFRVP
jgi:hypothetical protein